MFYNSLSHMDTEIEKRELDNTINGIDNPFAINSPLSQIMILDQNQMPSEEKTDFAITLLYQIRDSDTLSDFEKLEVYIYIHQKMDLEIWLIPVVKEFIHSSIEKMKLYLYQRNQSSSRKLVDSQSYVVLTNPFQSRANEIEFQGWSGLKNEQVSFHKWLAKARVKRASLEPRDYECEDSNSNV